MRSASAFGPLLVLFAATLVRDAPARHASHAPASRLGPVRGLTVGPIESSLHPGRGYGTDASARTIDEARRMGATWISLTPFGRLWDLAPTGVDPRFEAPVADNRAAIRSTIRQAHAAGLKVMLVPHLWVETGGWRALIDPGDEQAWQRWAAAYGDWVLGWAELAESESVELLSAGVELRNWVTTTHAPLFSGVLDRLRDAYSGPITYAANWDDVEDTVILGELDVIGINAFYPLAQEDGAGFETLRAGGRDVADRIASLSKRWHKPVLLTEIGYTTRPDPAVRPWEWPDGMQNVVVDPGAQADAYFALIEPLLETPEVLGFFVWRVYADPDDMSQEAEWGFNPRGKPAELVVRDAFAARWAADPPGRLPRRASTHIASY